MAARSRNRMDVGYLWGRLTRVPFYAARKIDVHVRLAWLHCANRYGRSPITNPGGPVVSLTSYGRRARSVHFALESIARGRMRPSRLILWLDDPAILDDLPIGIRRLQKRGLEVKSCENYGPHKKYYPYLESLQEIEVPMVTADDDVLYPRYWLKDLVEAFRRFPNVVNCHRARLVELDQERIAEYRSWEFADSTKPSFRHFAVGVGGVLYPPSLQQKLKREGAAFKNCCPKADDIWLHLQATRAGYKVRQVGNKAFRLVYIPGTQKNALYHNNLVGGENDRQIETTYGASDIDRLRRCESSPA